VLLANHGIVAIAPTAEGVDAISEMAVKAAAVRRIAYSVGGLVPLSEEAVAKFFARDDVAERRGNIAAGRL
jgi:ribulose-5-phosphate 4-epimerase/fuculose-1-phosphate aldolase